MRSSTPHIESICSEYSWLSALSNVLKGAASRFGIARALRLIVLHHRRAKACLAQICLCPSTPDDYFGDVLHIAGKNNLFLIFVAEEGFLLQFVQQIDLAVGIHNLPVRIRSIRHDKVVRQRQDALAVPCAVSDMSFISFRPLELAGGVHILSEG